MLTYSEAERLATAHLCMEAFLNPSISPSGRAVLMRSVRDSVIADRPKDRVVRPRAVPCEPTRAEIPVPEPVHESSIAVRDADRDEEWLRALPGGWSESSRGTWFDRACWRIWSFLVGPE